MTIHDTNLVINYFTIYHNNLSQNLHVIKSCVMPKDDGWTMLQSLKLTIENNNVACCLDFLRSCFKIAYLHGSFHKFSSMSGTPCAMLFVCPINHTL